MVQLWVVAGPNGAGKTSLVNERLSARAILDEFEVVNPDVIAQALPLIAGRLDERQAGGIAVRRRNDALAARRSLAIETTLSGNSTLRFMRRAGVAGYNINLIYIGLDSPELSLERVRARVADGGHDVPMSAIARRHPDSLAKLPDALSLSDRAYVLDNSGRRRRLVMIREAGRVRYLHPRAPGWFIQAVPAEFRKR